MKIIDQLALISWIQLNHKFKVDLLMLTPFYKELKRVL